MESHDEERMMYKNLNDGKVATGYSVRNLSTALDRVKAAALYYFSIPGPKMIWQFGELGYDIPINENGRTGAKPIKWDYYADTQRHQLFEFFSDVIGFKKEQKIFETSDFTLEGGNTLLKQITLKNDPYTTTPQSEDEMNVQVAVNFDVTTKSVPVNFPHTGKWYSYFDDQVINVIQVPHALSMSAGAYKLFTDYPLNVEEPVTANEEINEVKVRFFPNPVIDKMQIITEQNKVLSISVTTLQGQSIQVKEIEENIYDVSHLPAGLYIAQVLTSKGLYKLKVIKH
jgi:hypothetical protein